MTCCCHERRGHTGILGTNGRHAPYAGKWINDASGSGAKTATTAPAVQQRILKTSALHPGGIEKYPRHQQIPRIGRYKAPIKPSEDLFDIIEGHNHRAREVNGMARRRLQDHRGWRPESKPRDHVPPAQHAVAQRAPAASFKTYGTGTPSGE